MNEGAAPPAAKHVFSPHEVDMSVPELDVIEAGSLVDGIFPKPEPEDPLWVSVNRLAVQKLLRCLARRTECVSPNQNKSIALF